MVNRYSFNIEWREEDEEYIATCPAFPGLSAFGETEEEALKEAKIALEGFIETHKANRMALPEPIVHEAVSGKFELRLPKVFIAWLFEWRSWKTLVSIPTSLTR